MMMKTRMIVIIAVMMVMVVTIAVMMVMMVMMVMSGDDDSGDGAIAVTEAMAICLMVRLMEGSHSISWNFTRSECLQQR